MRRDTTYWGSGEVRPLGVVSCLSAYGDVMSVRIDTHNESGRAPSIESAPNEGESAMTITVYSKPNCVQCTATYRALDKHGVAYSTVDISADPEALDYVRSLGHAQAPVVVAGDMNWAGFRPDLIKQAVSQLAVVNG